MQTRVAENYLRTIYEIIENQGYVRTKDVANSMGVKASSASEMLNKLDQAGLVIYKKYSGISLTSEGKKLANIVNQKYKVFMELFEIAGVDSKVAYKDACILEHYISNETNLKIQNLVEKLKNDKQ
ncbi:MAG: metal-dependent transcriptional regulator [Candidatus Micrarchaeota archaeon]